MTVPKPEDIPRGRQAVIDVFGDACPVCSHGVYSNHGGTNDEWCLICGRDCGGRPWPPESVQRFQDYWARRDRSAASAVLTIPVRVGAGAVAMVDLGEDGVLDCTHLRAGMVVSPPADPSDDSTSADRPYTIWLDNIEGWHPIDCETLEDCFRQMHAIAHPGAYRITKEVDVEIREKQL